MKMFCISDSYEKAVGFRFTGIETVLINSKEESDSEIENVLKDKNIGVLLFTDQIYEFSKLKLDYIKEHLKIPLLVKI